MAEIRECPSSHEPLGQCPSWNLNISDKNNISVFIFSFHKMYVRVEIDKKIYYVKREKFDVFLFSEHLIPADKIDK